MKREIKKRSTFLLVNDFFAVFYYFLSTRNNNWFLRISCIQQILFESVQNLAIQIDFIIKISVHFIDSIDVWAETTVWIASENL